METKYKDYYTLKELERIYGKSRHTIRFWINKGWLKAKKGKNPAYKHEMYIKREDWLAIPTFMRNARKTKK